MSSTTSPRWVWLRHPVELIVPLILGQGCWSLVIMATPWLAQYQTVLMPVGLFALIPAAVLVLCEPERAQLQEHRLVRRRLLGHPETLLLVDIARIESGYLPSAGPRTWISELSHRFQLELRPQDRDQEQLLLELGHRVEALGIAATIQDGKSYDVLGLQHLNPRGPWWPRRPGKVE